MSSETAEDGQHHGVGIIVLKRESVLMVKRGKQPFLGRWSYPGGSVEAGESPEDAAVRELFEETGLTVRTPQMVGRHVVERAAPYSGTLTLHVYTARWQSGVPVAADDAAEAQFFGFEQVSRLVTTPQAELWLERARALHG
jgi:8-oxo-dGTP diphosphatase